MLLTIVFSTGDGRNVDGQDAGGVREDDDGVRTDEVGTILVRGLSRLDLRRGVPLLFVVNLRAGAMFTVQDKDCQHPHSTTCKAHFQMVSCTEPDDHDSGSIESASANIESNYHRKASLTMSTLQPGLRETSADCLRSALQSDTMLASRTLSEHSRRSANREILEESTMVLTSRG